MRFVEALELAKEQLALAGVTSSEADAHWILCYATGLARGELLAQLSFDAELEQEQAATFHQALERRCDREPLQHITGTAAFLDFEVEVGPGVFVPRPETESLVELGLQLLQGTASPQVLDVGSGSGVIPIAISRALPDANVIALEASEEASEYLQRNVSRLAPRVIVRNGFFPDVSFDLLGQLDLLISNPPYIPSNAVPLDPEVFLHDPKLALYSGDDGLDVIRDLVEIGFDLLKPVGALAIEHADGQSDAIVELLLAKGYQQVQAHRDLAGRFRTVSARK